MANLQEQAISLTDIGGGAVKELVRLEVKKVIENLADINTDYKKAREIDVKFKFTTREERDFVAVNVEVKSKLQPNRTVFSQLYMGEENGEIKAVELTKDVPGQMDMNGEETGECKIIDLGEKRKVMGE